MQYLAPHHDRNEQIGFVRNICARESARGDANYRKRITVNAQLASNCLRIAIEMRLPERVTKHHVRRCSGSAIVGFIKDTAQRGRNTKQVEIISRNEDAGGQLSCITAGAAGLNAQRLQAQTVARQAREHRIVVAHGAIIRIIPGQ